MNSLLIGAIAVQSEIARSAKIIGTLVTVTAFNVLVPNASALGTDQFPAPAAQAWKGVAEAISLGLSLLWWTMSFSI